MIHTANTNTHKGGLQSVAPQTYNPRCDWQQVMVHGWPSPTQSSFDVIVCAFPEGIPTVFRNTVQNMSVPVPVWRCLDLLERTKAAAARHFSESVTTWAHQRKHGLWRTTNSYPNLCDVHNLGLQLRSSGESSHTRVTPVACCSSSNSDCAASSISISSLYQQLATGR